MSFHLDVFGMLFCTIQMWLLFAQSGLVCFVVPEDLFLIVERHSFDEDRAFFHRTTDGSFAVIAFQLATLCQEQIVSLSCCSSVSFLFCAMTLIFNQRLICSFNTAAQIYASWGFCLVHLA